MSATTIQLEFEIGVSVTSKQEVAAIKKSLEESKKIKQDLEQAGVKPIPIEPDETTALSNDEDGDNKTKDDDEEDSTSTTPKKKTPEEKQEEDNEKKKKEQEEEEEKKKEEEEDKEDKTELEEVLGSLDGSQLGVLSAIASNPSGYILKTVGPTLKANPAILPIFGIFAAAFAVPAILEIVTTKLSVPGGPLDRRWRRYIKEEIQLGLTREEQKLTEKGLTLVIFSQLNTYAPNNEAWSSSNLYRVTENRIARSGLDDKAAGVRL